MRPLDRDFRSVRAGQPEAEPSCPLAVVPAASIHDLGGVKNLTGWADRLRCHGRANAEVVRVQRARPVLELDRVCGIDGRRRLSVDHAVGPEELLR